MIAIKHWCSTIKHTWYRNESTGLLQQANQPKAVTRRCHSISRLRPASPLVDRNRGCWNLICYSVLFFIAVTKQMPPIRGVTKRFVMQCNRKKEKNKKKKNKKERQPLKECPFRVDGVEPDPGSQSTCSYINQAKEEAFLLYTSVWFSVIGHLSFQRQPQDGCPLHPSSYWWWWWCSCER